MQINVRGPIWFNFYRSLVVLPLLVGVCFRPAGRGFLISVAIASGYAGLAILVLEFALVARLRPVAGAFGQDALQQFHKQMSYVAVMFIMAHAALLLAYGYPAGILNPFSTRSTWAWRWGATALFMLMALILLSVARRQLRIPYEGWQFTHRLLAPVLVATALTHIFMVGGFTGTWPMRALWIIYAAGFLGIAIYHRICMPLLTWQRPWTVVRNVNEPGDSRTLVLHPVKHSGISFEPGQFAWLNTGRTPFHYEEHPISFSSSAEMPPKGDISFTIKALGDWSRDVVPRIQRGATVWVDGPYGVFSPDCEQGPGYVLIGGGIGITPLYSMCLTMADREDARPVFLFCANRDAKELVFHDGLENLRRRMNLNLVYVLEHPPADWRGETGFVTPAILGKFLPKQYKRFQYFVCGPPPMMDALEGILPTLGIPAENIHTERFDVV